MELWIHSIHVTVSSASPFSFQQNIAALSGSKIDMNKVKSIMADMNRTNLLPQAKELMDQMEMKQKVAPIAVYMILSFGNYCSQQVFNCVGFLNDEYCTT